MSITRRPSLLRAFKTIVLAILSMFVLASNAQAQNTGGVFPPGFGPNHESVQYRLTFDTDTEEFANRLHYQKSIDSKRVWRVLAQTRETENSDFDFDFVQAELFWDGDNRREGIALSPRARIAKKLASGPSLGVEYFGSLGTTEGLVVENASQTIGPFVSTK